MMAVAVSVFPVPGGPTIIVNPGDKPLKIASCCVGVNSAGILFPSMKLFENLGDSALTPAQLRAKFRMT